MIGNITKGSNFKGLFEYLLHPNKQAEVIGGNVGIGSPAELEAEFIAFSSRNDRVKKVVTHISLGFAPQDGELESAQLDRIAERITEELGYRNAQYLAIRHGRHDPGHDAPHDHDHFHIVCNGG